MAVVTITKDNFEAEVLGCKIPVVLDFWAEWCEPCKMQSTVIEELAAELDGKVKFGKVNVDEEYPDIGCDALWSVSGKSNRRAGQRCDP